MNKEEAASYGVWKKGEVLGKRDRFL